MKAHFLLFTCLLLFACSGNPETDEVEKKEEGVTTIDVVNAKNYEGTLDPLIEDVYFLELETSEDALFTQVSKVLFVEEKMFILDIMSEKVLAFDNDGKFLFTVSKRGLGPGEYRGVSSIAYDYDKNELILAASGKLLWFDAFGKFIREEKSDIRTYIGDMAYLGNSQFAVYMDMSGNFGEEAVRAIVIDDKAKRVASYQPFSTDTRTENTTAMNSHFSSSQEPLAVGTYSHEVWKFNSKGAGIAYRFDFGEDAMPDDFLDTYITDPSLTSAMVRDIIADKGYWALYGSAVQEVGQNMFFTYSNRKEYRNGFFDKKTGKGLTFQSQISNDDGDKGSLIAVGSYNEYLVASYRSKFLSGFLDADQLSEDQKKTIELIGKEEVPLLWFVKFKNLEEIEVN